MDAQEQRRLLELAAKAVGFIDDATDESGAIGLHRGSDDVFYITSSDGWREWNPLTDDGDSRGLEVALRLSVIHSIDGAVMVMSPDISVAVTESTDSDQYATTRIAIVRAAAEIGESMRNE